LNQRFIANITSNQSIQFNPSRKQLMKLIYRGVTYDYDPDQARASRPTQPTRQSAYDLMYRGVSYRVDPTIAHGPAVKPRSYELMYRGNAYQVTRNEAGELTAMSCSPNLFQRKPLTPHSAIPQAADHRLR
jgi:hypothetical protein